MVVHGVIENGELQGDRVEVKHSDEYVSVNDERVEEAELAGCAPTTVASGAPASDVSTGA